MAIIKQIETSQGIFANYHNVFWYQGISTKEKDEIRAIIKSYVSKEKYLEGKEAVEQTELSFEIEKDFNGQLRTEIYNQAKELIKFENATDDI